MSKKTRSRNFSREEKILICEIAKNYSVILGNKKTDSVTNKQKLSVWAEIANVYNARQSTGVRNWEQLKAVYDVLKRKARKSGAVVDPSSMVGNEQGNEFIEALNANNARSIPPLSPQLMTSSNPFGFYSSDHDDASLNSDIIPEVKIEPISDDSMLSTKLEIDESLPVAVISSLKSPEEKAPHTFANMLASPSSSVPSSPVKRTNDTDPPSDDTEVKRFRKTKEEDDELEDNKCAEIELQIKQQQLQILQRRAAAEAVEAKIREETLLMQKETARVELEIKRLELDNLLAKRNNFHIDIV